MMPPADLIISGARIRTVDAGRPLVSAVAIRDGRIVATGSDDEVLAQRGPETTLRDLAGGVVYPGFVDVHNHHYQAGAAELFQLSFSPGLTLEQILDVVRRHAAQLPKDAWVHGGQFPSTMQEQLNSSVVRARLDDAAQGRPVMLLENSHHNRWVNSKALELAGITAESLPAEGIVLLDPDDGQPTGVLLEAAGIPVEMAMARSGTLTPEQHRQASRRGVEMLNEHGITAFQDAAVSLDILGALASLDRADQLDAWVVSSLTVNDPIFGYDVVGAELIARGEEFRTRHHRPDFVKIFLDGVPPARTASFLEPYLPDDLHGDDYLGETTMSQRELELCLREVSGRGLGAKVHCTGDGSAHMLLDVVERLRAEGCDTRFQIAHGQFLADTDVERMASLQVTADISPFIWFPGDIPTALATVLGHDRADHSQPNRDLIDAGALVAGGSDWPVSESPNPFEGLQGLVTRADPLRRAPGTLWPEQAIRAEEALAVFTINAARAMGLADETGSIEVGKSADLVLLDRDPLAGAAEEIIETRVLETWFAGRQVHVGP